MTRRTASGFGLIELIVALTILSVGVLALTGAAVVAHRSFTSADAIERAAHAAAAVLDSLMHEHAPVAGERVAPGATVRWTVAAEADVRRITATVDVADGGRQRRIVYHAVHNAQLVR